MFAAITNALWFNKLDKTKVNWTMLIEYLPEFEAEDLENAIVILGACHDLKMIDVLNQYKNHSNGHVRVAVKHAIEEIEFNN
ncbi:hypothetical protein [Thermoflavimicrobium daqui]|jgi:hypothetical protein|uniref:Uncharacterized protein n=1 Tax=Thermoflavimicrobium daqui TaxID=2137476 RepID=A0A364K5W7_9BACL|nr:hypothetical protein [Thermoflavimicrobium daqui]RAL25694.1 hypothetical protein DL897_06360 [Thermoflavimicrobium daqui]